MFCTIIQPIHITRHQVRFYANYYFEKLPIVSTAFKYMEKLLQGHQGHDPEGNRGHCLCVIPGQAGEVFQINGNSPVGGGNQTSLVEMMHQCKDRGARGQMSCCIKLLGNWVDEVNK